MQRLIALLLLWPSLALAQTGVFKLAVMPEQQKGVDCTGPDSAMTYTIAAYDWVAGLGTSEFAFTLNNGDLTEHLTNVAGADDTPGPAKDGDCGCLGGNEAQCQNVDHEVKGVGFCANDTPSGCAVQQAIDCDFGTPGVFCEWTRASFLISKLTAVGLDVGIVCGNHDMSTYGPPTPPGQWDYFDQYMRQPTDNVFFPRTTYECSSIWKTFMGGGIEWLYIGLSYQLPTGLLDAVETVLQAHDGKPTIVAMHSGVDYDCYEETETGWCSGVDQNGHSAPIHAIRQVLDNYSQVVAYLSGHVRTTYHTTSTNNLGQRILGAAMAYQGDLSGRTEPAWMSTDNGGGGVVTVLTVNMVDGWISSMAYSPKAEEVEGDGRDHMAGIMGASWVEHIPFCGDRNRFPTLTDQICADYVPPAVGPNMGHAAAPGRVF